MLDLGAGRDGHVPRDAGSQSKQIAITAEYFLPPRLPRPRPWERVAVAPLSNKNRRHNIWKRVSDPIGPSVDLGYVRAMAELETGGMGPRKRVRQAKHLSTWGHARWDARLDQKLDGKCDIAKARASVSAALEEIAKVAPRTNSTAMGRRSTFPEDSLKWVPRKRLSSRWPIEPKTERATHDPMVADTQPLVEIDVPVDSEPIDISVRIDEKQMRTRSTRRLSRRISLLPSDASPEKLSVDNLSPEKTSGPSLSPAKRQPVTLSPTKVTESPLRAFRISATPTKVVLESPKSSPPEQPLLKASTAMSTLDEVLPASVKGPADSSHAPASPLPLLFDQPITDPEAEPRHETRRRVSLHLARRIERGSSGVSRVLALKNSQNNSSRRHSLTSIGNIPEFGPENSKERRKTLDPFCVGSGDPTGMGISDENHARASTRLSKTEVLEIDAKANLDIFGQQPKAPGLTSERRETCEEEENEGVESVPESDNPRGAYLSPAKHNIAPHRVMPSSSATDVKPVAQGADAAPEVVTASQAATDAVAGANDIGEAEHPCSLDPLHFTFDMSAHPGPETDKNKVPVTTQDPEGLSTIYEESSIAEVQAPEEGAGDELSARESVLGDGPEAACELQAPRAEDMPGDESLPSEPQDTVVARPDTNCPRVSPPPCHVSEMPSPESGARGAPSPMDQETSGFTPINTRLFSPSPDVADRPEHRRKSNEGEAERMGAEDLDADEITEEEALVDTDDDLITADEDFTLMVEGVPHVENDTLQLRVNHDDSETEMLRNFVTRVTADKNAKAAAAAAEAAAIASEPGRPIRRSRPSFSVTSSSGSPIPIPKSDPDTPPGRIPLVEKSTNSPSPAKKRKLEELLDFPSKNHDRANPTEEDPAPRNNKESDGPRLIKRRRRRLDPVLAEPTPALSPEPENNPPRRRSTRTSARLVTRNTRVALRPSAPSANSIAFSMMPLRFPGMMGTLDDEAALEAHLAASARARQQRSEEKDLATVTRVNTRKNKAGAVPPQMVLAQLAEDPGWRMRELKGVFEAREAKEREGKAKREIRVRWAEELVTFHQGGEEDDTGAGGKVLAGEFLRDLGSLSGEDTGRPGMEVDEIAEAEPLDLVKSEGKPVVVKKAVVVPPAGSGSGSGALSSKRTAGGASAARRSSRLQAPTPVMKLVGGKSAKGEKPGLSQAGSTGPSRTRALPRLAPAPAPSSAPVAGTTPVASGSSLVVAGTTTASTTKGNGTGTGMATRRSKIAKLGMSVNGTPAPKRRGRAVS